MDRGILNCSGSRDYFPCEASLEANEDVFSVDGTGTVVVEQHRASPQNYQRYSYLLVDGTMSTATHSDATQRYDEGEEVNDSGASSTNEASEGDSMRKIFDPSERHAHLPRVIMKSKTSIHAELLLTDIMRCQTQVEELIELFKTSANVTTTATTTTAPATAMYKKISPATMMKTTKTRDEKASPLSETTPNLRQRFASRIPRCSAEMPSRDNSNLEDARKQLTQSLEDALVLLDRFPRERQLLRRSLTPAGDVPLSHNELLEAVDCLEQISLQSSANGDADQEEEDDEDEEEEEDDEVREHDLLAFGKRRSTSRFKDVDRLPVLEETLSLSSDHPCFTPSGYTGKEFWIHRNAADAMLSSPMSLSRASLFDEHHSHDHHDASTASDLWELFQTPSRNRDSSQPFRVFIQDPIQIGDLSRNSSQSLSGLDTEYAVRVHAHLERDAASDSEVLLTNDDILPSPRRCHSATAALCPSSSSSSAQTNTHQRYTSLAESSDWDVVEGGIAVTDDRQGHDAVPGRLTPDTIPWTSTAFSTIEFRPASRAVDVVSPSLCQMSRMSHVSEVSKSHMSRELQPRVDRSVQCDFSATSSERVTPWSGGCGFWFKKKNKKHRSNVLRRVLLSSSGMPRLGSDESSLAMETGILCGIRTAVRAALRPPCPHSKRDRDRRSSGYVSTCLYSESASSTEKASRSGPSAA